MRSSPVRYQLAVEGGGRWQVLVYFCIFFLFCFLRDGGRKEDNGVSGCSCVSFDLAVTSRFHTITNSPPTHPPPPPKAPPPPKKKSKVGGRRHRRHLLFVLMSRSCETSSSYSIACFKFVVVCGVCLIPDPPPPPLPSLHPPPVFCSVPHQLSLLLGFLFVRGVGWAARHAATLHCSSHHLTCTRGR